MIFGTGVLLFFAGAFVMAAWGTGSPYRHNTADAVGAGAFIIGFLMALGSLLHFASRWLS